MGCGTTEERFPEQFARKYCAQAKACDVDLYFETYEFGTETCRERMTQQVGDQQYGTEVTVCSWQPDIADDCLKEIRRATCDEVLDDRWVDNCTAAWDCVTLIDPA
jgi:hypothetical protein